MVLYQFHLQVSSERGLPMRCISQKTQSEVTCSPNHTWNRIIMQPVPSSTYAVARNCCSETMPSQWNTMTVPDMAVVPFMPFVLASLYNMPSYVCMHIGCSKSEAAYNWWYMTSSDDFEQRSLIRISKEVYS